VAVPSVSTSVAPPASLLSGQVALKLIHMFQSKIMLVGNILTAAAYFALTAQLLIFAKRFQV